jgi:hypothetical protein
MPIYRILQPLETLQVGDEYLSSDDNQWYPLTDIWTGEDYLVQDLLFYKFAKEVRRSINI